jgi:predicted RNA-binding protein with PIN domain
MQSGSFASEALRSLGVIAAFVGVAIGWAALERRIANAAPYPSPSIMAEQPTRRPPPTTWLVDGFNLLHAAVMKSGEPRDGWWKGANRDRVVALARNFEDREAELVVVFDGAEEPIAASEDGPRVVFAPTADDWLLAAVKAAPDPRRVAVVTADRRLADRLRDRGAQVVSPRAFAARCQAAL